ncbi:unnamed protein product [Arabidopsis thaliana]|uniref:(thale cress) hypothetical protein n=1 Tax=Arabidopsis thaliana TaxID=3702 RepID=A0A7G2FIA9_ARATH|nr:unnamed protein product [Arabidopsis thaliana]
MESLESHRAVALFASAHQNIDKKNSFAFVSEEIRRQMENIKSHILTNGQCNNPAKYTREHVETGSFFERAVALFSLARRNIENRMKSGAEMKNSSEIVACVSSKEIHKEMENIKSHIITNSNHIKVKLEKDF